MAKDKIRELSVSNYIIQNSNLLFEKSLKNLEVNRKGKVVELLLYYLPSSKFEVWNLKKQFYREPQYINHTTKKGMLCARFFAPSKFVDLIICKLETFEPTKLETTLYNFLNETKNPGRS